MAVIKINVRNKHEYNNKIKLTDIYIIYICQF